jgi:hypothetical protein
VSVAFSSEVGTGSHSNQVYADCVDLSAVENASKQKLYFKEAILNRRSFLICFRGLVAMKAVSAARSAWRMPLFRLRAY